ncbi:MAG: MarC family protein [Candidatus Omnitrophota bacterium]|nr:MarC family protein [Candidatus Omnitrophota bacterium]
MDIKVLLQSVLILFAIVNPIGSAPIFLQLTRNMPREDARKTFKTAVLTSGAILFVFIFAGQWVLNWFFRIQLYDLMAAGGLLLLIIAIDHLIFGYLAKSVTAPENKNAHHLGAVPIACPMLAGPGAMMTVLVTFTEYGFLTAAVSVVIVLAVTWGILHYIDAVYRFLGEAVCLVLSKILCLFLAAIGIHLLMQGLSYYGK